MSRALKIPLALAEEFQARYVRGRAAGDGGVRAGAGRPAIIPAFPCIPRWWQWTAGQLQQFRRLTTPFGRTRQFFGRPGDDTTLREAIAFLPQSTTADRMNLGLWRTWKREPSAQLLAQTYDSITFQAPEGPGFDELVGRVLDHIRVELTAPSGRRYVVPGEAKVGWNWGASVTEEDNKQAVTRGEASKPLNPEGLIKWKPGQHKRRRAGWGLDRMAGG
jgi:hypothetical protein